MNAINFISEILNKPNGSLIASTRLKNQADFYSLFAAVVELQREQRCPTSEDAAARLIAWLAQLREVEREEVALDQEATIVRYLGAARAASNDAGPRRVRIDIVKDVLLEA